MSTTIISAEIKSSDVPLFEALLKKFKAKSVKIEEKDPIEMSKEEFFAKIDKARNQKGRRMSISDFEARFVK